jgi:hypothetical protein
VRRCGCVITGADDFFSGDIDDDELRRAAAS